MPNIGTFGGFAFDPEVFSDYMTENPTWSNAIIASGILQEDSNIMSLIGEKGNIATLPFYKPISIEEYEPLNNDGNTDNTPDEISGSKQTAMLIQRMKAWKEQDFTKELTGANPMQHVANSVSDYYNQVWENELMNIVNSVITLPAVSNHIMDISAVANTSGEGTSGITVTDTNKIDASTMIFAQQKALGDMAKGFGLVIMHSYIYARYQALGLIDFAKYTQADGLTREVNLPTINGLVVVVSDRHTVDASGSVPVYKTTIVGQGAILTAPKTNYENPYYVDYDPESKAGIQKLYTKQGRVLHPNGFSIKQNKIAKESPTTKELGTTGNWELAFNEKNIKIGQIISNG